MSVQAAAEMEAAIRKICERNGVTRDQLRAICTQILLEEGEAEAERFAQEISDPEGVVFRTGSEDEEESGE